MGFEGTKLSCPPRAANIPVGCPTSLLSLVPCWLPRANIPVSLVTSLLSLPRANIPVEFGSLLAAPGSQKGTKLSCPPRAANILATPLP